MTGPEFETLRRPATVGRRLLESQSGVLQRDDPVLQKLVRGREDSFVDMEAEPAVRTAILQRVRGVSQHGWEVIVGSAATAKAERLRRFASTVLTEYWTTDNLPIFLDELLRGPFFGWGLWNLVWGPGRHDGRRVWTPQRAIGQHVWEFDLTTADEFGRHHVVDTLDLRSGSPSGSGAVFGRVYDQPADALRWFRTSAGSTQSPYGVAELSYHWSTWHTLTELVKLGSDVIQRNGLGILLVSEDGNSSAVSSDEDNAKQLKHMQEMLGNLRGDGALLQRSGYLVKWLQSHAGIRDFYRVLTDLRGLLRMALLGQNLTSEVKEGSYAAALVHGGVLDAINTGDALHASTALTRLVRQVIEVNYGPQDIHLLPTVRSRAARSLDPDRVRLALEAGLELDGDALAHEWALPLAPGRVGQVAALKRPLTPVPSPAQGRGAPPPYQGTDSDTHLTTQGARIGTPLHRTERADRIHHAATNADAQQAGLDRLQAASLPAAEPELRGAARGMLEHWLREHPDPFA